MVQSKRAIKIVLIGIGGYGRVYMRELLDNSEKNEWVLAGAVDPYAEASDLYTEIQSAGVPIFRFVEEFYTEKSADLAIICSPIHRHVSQMIFCLEHGSHVLCEKPICALIDDVNKLIDVRNRTKKQVAIGYQWSHSQAILDLKTDILQGRFGQCRRMKSIVLWPRNLAYFNRSTGWAGKRKSADGLWILDSVASNATAHYLHNMLFLAGKSLDRSASLSAIEAEAYRANSIETYDTCALRIKTSDDTQILFYASHAIALEKTLEPTFEFDFEDGQVFSMIADGGKIMIQARMKDGLTIAYGTPDDDNMRKLHWMSDVVRGERTVVCGLEAASAHIKCTNAISELIPDPPMFPADLIRFDQAAQLRYCDGLDEWLKTCFRQDDLPSEAGAGWALPARTMNISRYDHFIG